MTALQSQMGLDGTPLPMAALAAEKEARETAQRELQSARQTVNRKNQMIKDFKLKASPFMALTVGYECHFTGIPSSCLWRILAWEPTTFQGFSENWGVPTR